MVFDCLTKHVLIPLESATGCSPGFPGVLTSLMLGAEVLLR